MSETDPYKDQRRGPFDRIFNPPRRGTKYGGNVLGTEFYPSPPPKEGWWDKIRKKVFGDVDEIDSLGREGYIRAQIESGVYNNQPLPPRRSAHVMQDILVSLITLGIPVALAFGMILMAHVLRDDQQKISLPDIPPESPAQIVGFDTPTPFPIPTEPADLIQDLIEPQQPKQQDLTEYPTPTAYTPITTELIQEILTQLNTSAARIEDNRCIFPEELRPYSDLIVPPRDMYYGGSWSVFGKDGVYQSRPCGVKQEDSTTPAGNQDNQIPPQQRIPQQPKSIYDQTPPPDDPDFCLNAQGIPLAEGFQSQYAPGVECTDTPINPENFGEQANQCQEIQEGPGNAWVDPQGRPFCFAPNGAKIYLGR